MDGREGSTPVQEQDGQTDRAGRWWKVVASERQSWVSFGRTGQALGWVVEAERTERGAGVDFRGEFVQALLCGAEL